MESEKFQTKQKKGNIYKAEIIRIEYSINSLFLKYDLKKNGLLPFKQISDYYLIKFKLHKGLSYIKDDSMIKGEKIIVQVLKNNENEKKSILTTYINLTGCYLILIPNNFFISYISRKAVIKRKYKIKKKLINNYLSSKFGFIVRTAGLNKSLNELKWELDILISQNNTIRSFYKTETSPCLIYRKESFITRLLKDYLKIDLNEILIDNINIFNLIYKYLKILNSRLILKIKFYRSEINLFQKYKVEHQLELCFKREIYLHSGGSLTIDYSEAITSIDINSSRSNLCDDVEQTALQTNLESIAEISKQLRLRDLSGLIIVDFIDLKLSINKILVEKTMEEYIEFDNARIQLEKISRFNLMEISRQNLKFKSIEKNKKYCKTCNGTGKMHNIEKTANSLLKILSEEINKRNIKILYLETPIKIINYMINFKKNKINKIEKLTKKNIILISNKYLSIPNYKIYKA